MGEFKDLTGNTYGSLKVIKDVKTEKNVLKWLCKCTVCGELFVYPRFYLEHHQYIHNCFKPKEMKTRPLREWIYKTWYNMRYRCNSPKDKKYACYGGRGIKVCEEWDNNFEAFFIWAIETGYRRGLQIDRIDTNKGYSPSNCRWATHQDQQRNKRNNRP